MALTIPPCKGCVLEAIELGPEERESSLEDDPWPHLLEDEDDEAGGGLFALPVGQDPVDKARFDGDGDGGGCDGWGDLGAGVDQCPLLAIPDVDDEGCVFDDSLSTEGRSSAKPNPNPNASEPWSYHSLAPLVEARPHDRSSDEPRPLAPCGDRPWRELGRPFGGKLRGVSAAGSGSQSPAAES